MLRRAAADAVIARNGYEFGGARLRVEHAHRGAAGGGGFGGGGGGYGGGYGPPPYGGGYGGGYGGPPPRGGCEPLLRHDAARSAAVEADPPARCGQCTRHSLVSRFQPQEPQDVTTSMASMWFCLARSCRLCVMSRNRSCCPTQAHIICTSGFASVASVRRYGPPPRNPARISSHRCIVSGLPSSTSWQDLKASALA